LYTRFCAAFAKLCMIVAVAGLVAIIACVSVQVFGRYVLNDTPTWAEALALVLIIWVTMLGAAVGVRDAGHIGMETLLVLLPERPRHYLEIVIFGFSALFGILMAWNGAVLAESVWGYKIPTLGIPEGLNHVPVALGGALIVLFAVEHIIALVRGREVVPSWH
jgi:TRAP-type C4-dicarboxylate transport system permease small subunit